MRLRCIRAPNTLRTPEYYASPPRNAPSHNRIMQGCLYPHHHTETLINAPFIRVLRTLDIIPPINVFGCLPHDSNLHANMLIKYVVVYLLLSIHIILSVTLPEKDCGHCPPSIRSRSYAVNTPLITPHFSPVVVWSYDGWILKNRTGYNVQSNGRVVAVDGLLDAEHPGGRTDL